MRTRRLLRSAALAALAALALTGCVKMDMDLQLQPDDTVDGSMVFALESSIAEMSGEDPESLADQMREDLVGADGSFQDARVEPYDDGEYVGTTLHFEDEPLDVFAAAGEQDGLTVVREGDEFVVTGAMDLTETSTEDMEMFADSLDLRIAVTFPGPVRDHNGTLDGRTVSWEPTPGELVAISARGDATAVSGVGSLSLPVLVVIGLVALLVVALVVFVVARGKRGKAESVAPADQGAAYGAPGGYTGPQPGYAPEGQAPASPPATAPGDPSVAPPVAPPPAGPPSAPPGPTSDGTRPPTEPDAPR